MSKISCHIIQDILPLYVDGIVSEDTKEMVEEHLRECEAAEKKQSICRSGSCFRIRRNFIRKSRKCCRNSSAD